MECTKFKELQAVFIKCRAERVKKLLTQGSKNLNEQQLDKFEHEESEALWLILKHREEHDGCSWL